MSLAWGREICGDLPVAKSREWLCTNGIGGFASGIVPGVLRRRYHGLLIAALKPTLGRTMLVAKVDEQVEYAGLTRPLLANRWGDGAVAPSGDADLQEFRLDGTTSVWTYACTDARRPAEMSARSGPGAWLAATSVDAPDRTEDHRG